MMDARSSRSELELRRVADNLSALIDEASFGLASWQAVTDEIARMFPGSMASLHRQDFVARDLNFIVASNLDDSYFRTFKEHYAFVNPWIDLWKRVPNGAIRISEQHSPVRLIAKSEFYNDWLRPQKTLDAAVGMKIDCANGVLIHLPVHYSMHLAERYDAAVAKVLQLVRGNLMRASLISGRLAESEQRAAAQSALLERAGCVAVVVDRHLRLHDANQSAVDRFAAGGAIRGTGGFLSIADRNTHARLRQAVGMLLNGAPEAKSRLHFSAAGSLWTITLARLPAVGPIAALNTLPKLALLLFEQAMAFNVIDAHLPRLAEAFLLSPAESRLCAHLVRGLTLADCAAQLGISVETARSHLKRVFDKTGARRQAELMLLLLNILR
jgi:DNA-binding CsgD family transcriptional regulator